ncbi:MAG: response regulator [Albidovulum sp.]
MDGTVLVADDDRTIRTVLTQALTRAGCKVHATSSMVTLLRWVEEGKGDLVISDVIMPDGNGIESLPLIAASRPGLPVIIISAQNTILTAIQVAEAAAFDYLPKPFDLPELLKRVAQALSVRRRKSPPSAPAEQPDLSPELPMIGKTPDMQALYRLVARVVNTDIPVLITGESGSGKSQIARAIHDFSDRRSLPVVTAQGADVRSSEGLMSLSQRVRGGTLIFDEISDLDDDAQGRIVRMLDTMTESGPRILAISQANLEKRMEDGLLRKDLYFRLGGVTLDVPPLRLRVEDIGLLCDHFLGRAAREGLPCKTLAPDAQALIRSHPWPGNVRQLENTLRRLVLTSVDTEITKAEVVQALSAETSGPPQVIDGEKLSASVARHLDRYFKLHAGALPPPGLYDRILREIEGPLIEIALEATGGNQAKCADLLGINRNTLRKKLTELDIRVTRRRKLM